jgi:hypothetical protein
MDWSERKAVWAELFDDVNRVADLANAAPGEQSQFWRRLFCRNLFGMVEAWLSFVREDYLPRRRAEGVFGGEPEKAAYFESMFAATEPNEWTLNDKGEAQQRNRKLSFPPYMKACIRMMYLLHGKPQEDAQSLFGSHKWCALMQSSRVRDGLMHPHAAEDIRVSDEAVRDMGAAIELVGEMLRLTTKYTEEYTEKTNREVERLYEQAAESLRRTAARQAQSVLIRRLHQELRENRLSLHGLIVLVGDKASGRLLKQRPQPDGALYAEDIEVIAIRVGDETCLLLRPPGAPRLEEGGVTCQ